MGYFKKRWNEINQEIRNMANHDRLIKYDVVMGILSSGILCILEALSYLFIPADSTLFHEVYLLLALLMAVQFAGFFFIYRNGYEIRNWVSRIIWHIHPFLIVFAALAVVALKRDTSQNTDSFLLAIFTVILVQIYPAPKRAALFLFGFLGFNLLIFGIGGPSLARFEAFRASFLVCLLGYIYATVHYQSQTSRIDIMAELKEENRIKTEINSKLSKMNEQLESSHRITDALLRITNQILSTDQLDETLQMLLDEAIHQIPAAQAGSVLTLSGDRMKYRASRGYDLQKLKKITLGMEDIFQSTQADLFEPMIIRDLLAFNANHLDQTTFAQFQTSEALTAKSILTCAFKLENQFFGLINLDNYESADAFQEEDRALIAHLAKQLEISIGIHKLYEKAIRPTKIDGLTGAFTRRYHQELLTKAITKARIAKTIVAVGTLDINFFKEINDRHGHEVGDNCLAYFGEAVRHCLSGDAIFSRVGGDEFALVYPDCGMEEAQGKVASIQQYLREHPFRIHESDVVISFACGFALFPEDGDEFDVLFRISDDRMYENKMKMKGNPFRKA